MAFSYPHQIFKSMATIAAAAGADLDAVAARAGGPFPINDILAMAERPTYENMSDVDHKVCRWMISAYSGQEDDALSRSLQMLLLGVDEWRPFRRTIMPSYAAADGGGMYAVPHFASVADHGPLLSLGQACHAGLIDASVFDQQIQAEKTYDTAEYLAYLHGEKPKPEPVGSKASYKICFLNGELHHPPLWPSEAVGLAEADDDTPKMDI